MRTTDTLCGTCTCGRDFEIPVNTHPNALYHCPSCGITLLIEWESRVVTPEPEPEPLTISDEEGLK